MVSWTGLFGDHIVDPEEESFLVFSQPIPSQDLGFVDAKASVLELAVAGRELSIHQSPSLLTSNRAEGTTGAVVWGVTPLFAEWVVSAASPFFKEGVLSASSTVVELGTGVSGVVALSLGPKVSHYIATDQDYVLKLLRQNIAENAPVQSQSSSRKDKSRSKTKADSAKDKTSNIAVLPLDWETSQASSILPANGVDMIVACDCIYNEALIDPFVGTCADICRIRTEGGPTICIIAQQLRSPDVFEAWLKAFWNAFTVWRVPDDHLPANLKEGSGFVIHVGILKLHTEST